MRGSGGAVGPWGGRHEGASSRTHPLLRGEGAATEARMAAALCPRNQGQITAGRGKSSWDGGEQRQCPSCCSLGGMQGHRAPCGGLRGSSPPLTAAEPPRSQRAGVLWDREEGIMTSPRHGGFTPGWALRADPWRILGRTLLGPSRPWVSQPCSGGVGRAGGVLREDAPGGG